MGYAVAPHNSTKNIDQNCFHVGILKNDAERRFNALGICCAAYVQEISRASSGHLDDVHGGHRQTGAVHHATHGPVQFHKIQTGFAGFYFRGVFFAQITQGSQFGMAEQSVVVQRHLGVYRNDFVVRRFQNGINFKQRSIDGNVRRVQALYEGHHFLKRASGAAQIGGNFARLKRLQANGWIY